MSKAKGALGVLMAVAFGVFTGMLWIDPSARAL